MSPAEYELPIDSMARYLQRSGQSIGASGLFMSVAMAILDLGRPLPSDERVAAKIVNMHPRTFKKCLDECLECRTLVRLPSGEIWAPIVDEARPVRPSRAARSSAAPRAPIAPATREDVLRKTNGKCVYCGVLLSLTAGDPTSFEPDHVLPVVEGGSDDMANLVPSCRSCNRKKRSKTALQFMGGREQ